VMKVYQPKCIAHFENECKMVQQLANFGDLRGHVTAYVDSDSSNRVLLLSPAAIPFAYTTRRLVNCAFEQVDVDLSVGQLPDVLLPRKTHWRELLRILKLIHGHKIVHRDVVLSNIFIDPKTRLLFVNDWSCAVPTEEVTVFNGTWLMAPDAVLRRFGTALLPSAEHQLSSAVTYKPVPEHDLETVVKGMFAAVHPQEFYPRQRHCTTMKDLLDVWEKCLKVRPWPEALELARRGNHEALIKWVKESLF